jgi:hypothetical protein
VYPLPQVRDSMPSHSRYLVLIRIVISRCGLTAWNTKILHGFFFLFYDFNPKYICAADLFKWVPCESTRYAWGTYIKLYISSNFFFVTVCTIKTILKIIIIFSLKTDGRSKARIHGLVYRKYRAIKRCHYNFTNKWSKPSRP